MKSYHGHQLIVFLLITLALNSCNQTSKKMNFSYKINGNHRIINENYNNILIPIKGFNFKLGGNMLIDFPVLQSKTLFETNYSRDSTITLKTVDNKDIMNYYSIVIMAIKRDTFFVIANHHSNQFLLSGTISADILTVNNENDSIKVRLNSSYIDTIMIADARNKYSEKMAYHVIDNIIMEQLKQNITDIANDIYKKSHIK